MKKFIILFSSALLCFATFFFINPIYASENSNYRYLALKPFVESDNLSISYNFDLSSFDNIITEFDNHSYTFSSTAPYDCIFLRGTTRFSYVSSLSRNGDLYSFTTSTGSSIPFCNSSGVAYFSASNILIKSTHKLYQDFINGDKFLNTLFTELSTNEYDNLLLQYNLLLDSYSKTSYFVNCIYRVKFSNLDNSKSLQKDYSYFDFQNLKGVILNQTSFSIDLYTFLFDNKFKYSDGTSVLISNVSYYSVNAYYNLEAVSTSFDYLNTGFTFKRSDSVNLILDAFNNSYYLNEISNPFTFYAYNLTNLKSGVELRLTENSSITSLKYGYYYSFVTNNDWQSGYNQGLIDSNKKQNEIVLSKDNTINDLKKQIDTLNDTLNGYRNNEYSFESLFWGIGSIPFGVLSQILNFELMGINLFGLVSGLLTAILLIWLIKRFFL